MPDVFLFYVGTDIAGSPAIRLGSRNRGRMFKGCLTWPGAYFGAAWRNLLGDLYVPFDPNKRFDISFERERAG